MEAPTMISQQDDISVSSGVATSNDDASPSRRSLTSPNRRNRALLGGATCVIAVVLTGIIIAACVYFTSRPKAIPIQIVESSTEESVPSIVKAAALIDPSGTIRGTLTIEYTTLLSDPSMTIFYLNGRDLSFSDNEERPPSGPGAKSSPITLYLTRSSNPTVDDALMKENSSIVVADIAKQELPYRLPQDFFPGEYNGVLIQAPVYQEVLVASSFDMLVNPEQNIVSTDSFPENDHTPQDVPLTGDGGAINDHGSSMLGQQHQDKTPEDSTNDQQEDPQESTMTMVPPILVSSLEGSYGIAGTITINYRNDLGSDRQVHSIAVMTFEIPSAPSGAPLPILYLSKRPFSETKRGDLTSDDLVVPLDGAERGSFTLQGNFEQVLDEIDKVSVLNDFTTGSWIVWCEPFSVWLGGGPLEIKQ